MTYRYPDDLLRRILAGCRTGEEWWGQHPDLPIEVSNLGNVRGVRGFILKPYPHNGYPAVDICGRRHVRVHTLVLETFIGYRPDGLECCHWDNDKTNVKLDNLRWDTHSANLLDRWRGGLGAPAPRHPTPRFARQRHEIARRLAVLDKLEQLATG